MYRHKDGIFLRKAEPSDLRDLYALKQEGTWGNHTNTLLCYEDQEDWLATLGNDAECLIGMKGDENIGVLLVSRIDYRNRVARLSASIYPNARKAEIIKPAFACGVDYCFEMLNLHRLDGEVLETNVPAQRLEIGYLGFQVEGRRRQAIYKAGIYVDSIVIGLLREDWVQQSRVRAYKGSCSQGWDHETAQRLVERSRKSFPCEF